MNKVDASAQRYLSYTNTLADTLNRLDWSTVNKLSEDLFDCWKTGRQVFIAGNGGSGGNAVHLANDFLYALSKKVGSGLRIHALPANPAVVTCLANDEGYDSIFALQLAVMARPGDVFIAFSGSGNSPNIINALEMSKEIGVTTYGFYGFTGGKAKTITDFPIHSEINDMQIAEDIQLVVGHMLMQQLSERRDEVTNGQAE